MMKSVLILLGLLALAIQNTQGACQTCYKQESYTSNYKCGPFGWFRCTRTSYRQTAYSCRCSVDGQWSDWTALVTWRNDCSTTCGSGTETGYRSRTCTNPAPAYGGKTCEGSDKLETKRTCQIKECPVDGAWSDYSAVVWSGTCSTTCGDGIEAGIKTRTCTNPSPAFGGKTCDGESSAAESRDCKLRECPIDGGWSTYSSVIWSGDCSTTCGKGVETGVKTRSCSNPAPAFGGKQCEGEEDATESRNCNLRECPIDGAWSDYSAVVWSGTCSTTCGDGIEAGIKTRTCTNPSPAFGGKMCDGESSTAESRDCKLRECPIDGGWSEYGPFTEWSECSVTCGTGVQIKSHERTCNNPLPQFGGKDCEGEPEEEESKPCDMKKCPDVLCEEIGDGRTAHLQDCTKYLSCLNGIVTVMNCSAGLVWDNDLNTCAYPTDGNTCIQPSLADPVVSCTSHGQYLPHPNDCHKYYQCLGLEPQEMTCQHNLAWNEAITACDHPENVALCNEVADDTADDAPAEPNETLVFSCDGKDGFFADPNDCTKYFWCAGGYKYDMSCAPGTHFQDNFCVIGDC